MFTQDILLQVTSKTDNKVLEALSHTLLWNDIRKFAEDQYFWKLRVESLVSRELKYSSRNWKNIFYILEKALKNRRPFSVVDTSDVTAIKILLDLGHNPSADHNSAFFRAAGDGDSEVIKLLLADKRVDPTPTQRENALVSASEYGHTEVVKLLLADSRIDPSSEETDGCLLTAVENERTEVVKLLLADGRVDPTLEDRRGLSSLMIACVDYSEDIVRLLLADPRVDPVGGYNDIISEAASEGYISIVKLLLSDKRVRSSGGGNIALYQASAGGHIEVVKLLLREPSVDPSHEDNEAVLRAAQNGHLAVVKLLLSDKRVRSTGGIDRALNEAYSEGELDLIEELLSDPLIDSSHIENMLDYVVDNGSDMMDIILKNKKTNLDKIARRDDFKRILDLVFPFIRGGALGFYMNRDKSTRKMNPYYKSLVLLLILRRPSFEEALRWILLHPNREMRDAAKSLSSGRIDHKSPLISAYLGFLLLSIPDMYLLKIQKLLQSEGASKQGIDLASGLIGAFLGSSSREPIDSGVLYELLK